MKYYSIFLPVQTDLSDIIYTSLDPVIRGARVVVTFNRRTITGICNQEVPPDQIVSSIKYKSVLEILDSVSILPDSLLALAQWISKYYCCSAGKAIFAMLPSVIIPEVVSHIRWIGSDEFSTEYASLYTSLSDDKSHPIAEIKKAFLNKPLYKIIESAEQLGLVEVKRAYDSKVKPKTVNYLKVKSCRQYLF